MGTMTAQSAIRPDERPVTAVFFVPHQDDEVLTLGVAIVQKALLGRVVVVLCTDGANCPTRLVLGDGKSCPDMDDRHVYQLSKERYSQLRDEEFRASCKAMGIAERDICIPSDRMVDGDLGLFGARRIIRRYAALYPDAVMCTHAPQTPVDQELSRMPWASEHLSGNRFAPQHLDHRLLGQALIQEVREGTVRRAELYVEPYHLQQFLAHADAPALIASRLEGAEAQTLAAAIDEYMRWDESAQRYALGLHSAREELRFARAHCVGFHYALCRDDEVCADGQDASKHRAYAAPLVNGKRRYPELAELSEEDQALAQAGYRLFFESFVGQWSQVFLPYTNFVHKYYGNPDLQKCPGIIVGAKGQPAAMIWNMRIPFLLDGCELPIVTSGDYCASAGGRGIPAIAVLKHQDDEIKAAGFACRYGTPMKTAYALQNRFGLEHIGFLRSVEFCAVPAQEKVYVDPLTYWGATLCEAAGVAADCVAGQHVAEYPVCPFAEMDYQAMNAPDGLIKPRKSAAYYWWHIDGLEGRRFLYVLARPAQDASGLDGYLVLDIRPESVRVVDWDLYCKGEYAVATLAKLLARAFLHGVPVRIDHLNEARGELALFERLGAKPRLNADGEPVQNDICVRVIDDERAQEYCDLSKWKLHECDSDFHLNCDLKTLG